MYQCLGCEDIVGAGQSCHCGKLQVTKKGKAVGEHYQKTPAVEKQQAPQKNSKTKVRKCPKCGWEGLVVPRAGIGCPDHGVWFAEQKAKKDEDDQEGSKYGFRVNHQR